MVEAYTEGKSFNKADFTLQNLKRGDYENCTFISCDFSGANMSEIKFLACVFESCNLSNAILAKTSFQDVIFTNCKMLGLHFENCSDFGLSFQFEGCILDHSCFYRKKIRGTIFRNTKLTEVDFTETDLAASVMEGCELAGATFDHTNLEKADLRSSVNYSINPETNRIRKAKFSRDGIPGLLDKYDIFIE